MLIMLVLTRPDAPLLAFQLVPAGIATATVSLGFYLLARRGGPKRALDRRVEPVAAEQVRNVLPIVLVVAIGLALIDIPTSTRHPAWQDGLTFGAPLAAPRGWHETEQRDYPWGVRVYGSGASITRQRFVADTGNPRWDKAGKPRTVVVDTTTTRRPFALEEGVVPPALLYDLSGTRVSESRPTDLGNGITGAMTTMVDDRRFITWNLLTWVWRNEDSAQRIMIGSVDNHELGAPFPEPTGAPGPLLRNIFSVLFRGSNFTTDRDPTFKDAEMLTLFGRGLIDAQLATVGGRR
jgi:hypothetical protein